MSAPGWQILRGDCREVLADMEANSVDAIVTDPPYGLGDPPDPRAMLTDWLAEARHEPGTKGGFMGHDWDRTVPGPEVWVECARVLKPGGHLLAFAGSRTVDLMGLAIRLAGLEIRDSLCWLYGEGMPKGTDLGRQIDRHLGAEPEAIGPNRWEGRNGESNRVTYGEKGNAPEMRCTTPEGQRYQGWSTQLKPAHEPIIMARKKPDGSVAANVLAHGTGALNIDPCRIPVHPDDPVNDAVWTSRPSAIREGTTGFITSRNDGDQRAARPKNDGRYPANLILDGEAAAELDGQSGELRGPATYTRTADATSDLYNEHGDKQAGEVQEGYGDIGGASRFFYKAKATTAEREVGLESFDVERPGRESYMKGNKVRECRVCQSRAKPPNYLNGDPRPWPTCGHDDYEWVEQREVNASAAKNIHPTVKPIDLMRWLVRLVTPPGGRVLDPFNGSGTTGIAAGLEGLRYTGIELDDYYAAMASARLAWWAEREGDTAEILRRAGAAKKLTEGHREAGQLDLLADL